ncbi:MAG: aspartate-semialdehyde dehydrogenase [Erythrobacter sp.]|nr:aspartate-semialdehyde dehydrogenase [Erythrobacter sp.]
MRKIHVAMIALVVAACDGGSQPPPGQEPLRPSRPQVAENEVVLSSEGLTVGSESFYFAAGQNEVERKLSSILGAPQNEATNPDCGQGTMDFTGYRGGLTVNFRNGALVGWEHAARAHGNRGGGGEVRVAGDIALGMARAEAAAVEGFQPLEKTALGDEFALGERMGGFITQDRVSIVYAGATCFVRQAPA